MVRSAPFTRTTAPSTKLAPLTVKVNPAPPTSFVEGSRLLIDGTGLPTVKEADVDVPPPGAGFVTVTGYVPAVVMSDARIAAVNWVGLTKLVTRATLLNFTTEVPTKFVPSTVNVKAPELAVLDVGDNVLIVGTGLLMLRATPFDGPPPGAGFTTVIEIDPAALMSAAGILAVTWLAFTNEVVRAAPLTLTVEELTKLEPLTVNVKAASPTVLEVGLKVVIAGIGLLTVKLVEPDGPPPGAGLKTVTETLPALATSAAVMAAVS